MSKPTEQGPWNMKTRHSQLQQQVKVVYWRNITNYKLWRYINTMINIQSLKLETLHAHTCTLRQFILHWFHTDKYFILVQGLFKEPFIFVPRGSTHFGQHQELWRLEGSNFLSMCREFILFSQPIRFVRLTIMSMHRVEGSLWIMDFQCWTFPEVGADQKERATVYLWQRE